MASFASTVDTLGIVFELGFRDGLLCFVQDIQEHIAVERVG